VGEQRLRTAEALGSRGTDVVLVEHVERGRPHVAQEDRTLGRDQRECRQHEGAHGAPRLLPSLARKALGGKVEATGQDGDERDADEELRHGDAELSDRRQTDAVRPAMAHGGVDAERHGERQ